VELPEGTGCSPQASRRISSGSLLKASEVVSLAASAARFGGSSLSLRHERTKSIDKTDDIKKLPIINPLVRLPMWPSKYILMPLVFDNFSKPLNFLIKYF
jgi:diacylglycerol kinase (ATP)